MHKIPKLAHFYWGNKTLPFLRYMTIYSFHKLNPDWKINFYYTENNSKIKTWVSNEHDYEIDISNDCYNELKKLPINFIKIDDSKYKNYPEVFKSDLLRWNLLSNEGGLWSDMDIIYTKPMYECSFNIPENCDKDTIVQINKWNSESVHTIGFLLSSKYNKFYEYISKKSVDKINFENYQSVGVVLFNYEFPTLNSIKKKIQWVNPISSDFDLLYAFYPHSRMDDMFKVKGRDYRNSKSIGIHWYGGYVNSGLFCNKVRIDNYQEYKNTIVGKEICDIMNMK